MILEKIRQRAASNLQHIILPEGEDARTIQAAEMCARDRIAKITIIGDEEKVRDLARQTNANLNGVEILDHLKSNEFGKIATFYHELRRAKGITLKKPNKPSKMRFITEICSSNSAKPTVRSPARRIRRRTRLPPRCAASAFGKVSEQFRRFF